MKRRNPALALLDSEKPGFFKVKKYGDFLKLSFHMFPYNEILKVYSCNHSTQKYLHIRNFSQISEEFWELRVSKIFADVLAKILVMTS